MGAAAGPPQASRYVMLLLGAALLLPLGYMLPSRSAFPALLDVPAGSAEGRTGGLLGSFGEESAADGLAEESAAGGGPASASSATAAGDPAQADTADSGLAAAETAGGGPAQEDTAAGSATASAAATAGSPADASTEAAAGGPVTASKEAAAGGPAEGASLAGGDACPRPYERISVSEIAARVWDPNPILPYLFGGPRRPSCTNCNRTELFGRFCQYLSHGPICPAWVRASILASWLSRKYELPLTLTPCDFWPHIRGRTLWVMGDSMSLDFYKAIKCFFFEFWPALEGVPLTQNQTLQKALTDFKVAPECAELLGGTRVCYVRSDNGQHMPAKALPLLLDNGLMRPADLLVANFGLHHSGGDFNLYVDGFLAYYKANKHRMPRLLWQQTLAQHFTAPGGLWPGGRPPYKCHAIDGFKLEGNGTLVKAAGVADRTGVLQGQFRNAIADPAMRAAGVPIIQSFNESVPLWAAHRDNGQGWECSHYCHPAALQASVAALYRTLQEQAQKQGKAGQLAPAQQ